MCDSVFGINRAKQFPKELHCHPPLKKQLLTRKGREEKTILQ
jgi:hypothetical protein